MCKFCGFDNGFLHHAALGLVALVLTVNVMSVSAVPQAPSLPNEFRTTFNVSNNVGPLAHVRTWYDYDHKKQRFDIFDYNSFGWTITINRFDLSTPMQYNLSRSFSNWICIPGKLQVPMMAPNFLAANAKYAGTGTVNGKSVNNWQDTIGRVWSTLVASPFSLVQMVMPDKVTQVVFGQIHSETLDPNVFAFPAGSSCPTASASLIHEAKSIFSF